MDCLLCGSSKVKIKETHDKQILVTLWAGVPINVENDLKLDEVVLYECGNCGLKFFDPVLAGGDSFYSELGKQDWYYLHPGKTEYDYVQKFIKEGDNVLDIGSGRGVLFDKTKKKIQYTGLELSTKAVQLAQEAGINVIQEDLLIHAENHKSSYDIVCLFQVLEHLTELDHFIEAIKTCLKKDGLFVIAVPDNDGFVSKIPNYTFNLPPHHTLLWKEKSLKFLAEKFGFDVVEVNREPLQDIHRSNAYKAYIVSFLRKLFFQPDQIMDSGKKVNRLSGIVDRFFYTKWFEKNVFPILKKRELRGQSIIITLKKR